MFDVRDLVYVGAMGIARSVLPAQAAIHPEPQSDEKADCRLRGKDGERRPGARLRYGIICACVLTASFVASPGFAEPNLSGTWLIREGTSGTFIEIEQSGDMVSFTYAGVPLSGTVSAEGRLRMEGGDGPEEGIILDGDVAADASALNAAILLIGIQPGIAAAVSINMQTFVAVHCSCVDGNTMPGDGCDPECQVEPCWTCTGEPLTCAPAADGTACERSACIVDSTCAARVCTGGTVRTPCVDMSGNWSVDTVVGSTFVEPFYEHTHLNVSQRASRILVGGRSLGTIDVATGRARWTELGGFYGFGLCGDDIQAVRMPFSATVAADGMSFSAEGIRALSGSRCPLAENERSIAVRDAAVPCAPNGSDCSVDACHSGQRCIDAACQGDDAQVCSEGMHCEATRACVSDSSGLGCPGDCNYDGVVAVNELVSGVNIALDRKDRATCPAFDRDFNERLEIHELVGAVHSAVAGCGG